MIYVDSNVFMYLVGAPHSNRDVLENYFFNHPEEEYVTSVEVLQEITHRYVAVDRRRAIGDAFELVDNLVHMVYPISREDVDRAHEIALAQKRISGRDCLHLAVMTNRAVDRVLTLDRDFGLWPGVEVVP